MKASTIASSIVAALSGIHSVSAVPSCDPKSSCSGAKIKLSADGTRLDLPYPELGSGCVYNDGSLGLCLTGAETDPPGVLFSLPDDDPGRGTAVSVLF